MRFFLLFLLAIIGSAAQAQTGNYFLSHYYPTEEKIDFRSNDMVQDIHGELYFANRAGVLEFDGFNWNVISVPGAVYTMIADSTDVLIGGLTGAGRLNGEIQSPRSYEMFSETSGIFSSTLHDDKAYFCSENQLLIYSLDLRKLSTVIPVTSSTGTLTGVFNLGEAVVVSTVKNGLFTVHDKTFVPYLSELSDIIFSSPSPSEKQFLIGTRDNRIFIKNENGLKEIVLKQPGMFSHPILADGVWASENLLAIGTLRGGVIFVNAITGETEGTVDYSNGLPDNEVFSLLRDKNEGIWVAHEYGFTRIAINLPFRSFHNYPGLEGNLLCVHTFQDRVYVGTSLGLYMLKENVSEQNPNEEKKEPTISYNYVKIDPIEGKINQLFEIDGSLFAFGAGGIFEVNGLRAKAIIEEPVRNAFHSLSLNQVLVSSFNNDLRTFIPEKKGWTETHFFDSLHNHFSYMFEDNLENVWLCGSTTIFKVETVDKQIIEVIKYPIQNPTGDEVLGLALGSEVYVVSSGQFKHFNGSGFEKYDSLPGGHRYFASAGNFWFYDGIKWGTVDRNLQSVKLEWLGIFPSLRFLSSDVKRTNLWAITGKNELYRFNNDQTDSVEPAYPLFLREVRGTEIKMTRNVEIEQTEDAFTFEFIRPDYIGSHANEYRYLVKGLNRQWSPWSTSNNVINFSFLPAGDYQLKVQSKNALGVVSEPKEVAFTILPPYWKRWWFYALEFVVFSFLVSLSIILARRHTQYRYLSQVLTILTVVMLIQFIQTTIESLISFKSSPVVDFFIQVCIALLVFPVEIVARNSMQKIVQNKYSIHRLFNSPED